MRTRQPKRTLLAAVSIAIAFAATACGGTEPAPAPTGLDALPSEPCKAWEDDPSTLCLTFGPVEVPPAEEWQGYQAIQVTGASDLAVVGMTLDQLGAASHHFIVGAWNNDETDPYTGGPHSLLSTRGLFMAGYMTSLVGSVFKYVDIDTGKYVGVELVNDWLVMNGHYVNTTDQPIYGYSRVRIKTVPADDVRFIAYNRLPGTSEIFVPPGEERPTGGTWAPATDVAVMLLTSHMHRHGKLFRIWKTIDGEESLIYETDDYEAPPLEIFSGPPGEDPILLRKSRGDHLRYECIHRNHDLDTNLTFGPFADEHEMCIMPLYYVDEPDALMELIETADPDDTSFGYTVTPYSQ